jgi:hypothetical protein
LVLTDFLLYINDVYNKIIHIYSIFYKFNGIIFLGKIHNTIQHIQYIQYIKFIKREIELSNNILECF